MELIYLAHPFGGEKENVEKVVHGEWMKHGLGTHQWFCSVCEGKESAKRPYCPRCGARMESEGGT